MLENYLLLLVTGVFSIYSIYDHISNSNQVEKIWAISVMFVFILVLIATLLGIDYNRFIMYIEGR